MPTCSNKNYHSEFYKTFNISENSKDKKGLSVLLIPSQQFMEEFDNNTKNMSEEEKNKYYIEQYYQQILSKLDPQKIYNEIGNSLLISEDDTRHIVAEWIEIQLDQKIVDVKVNGLSVERLERPEYIRVFLEEIMKKTKKMRGFESLRALYLFEQGEELEQKANELEETNGKYYDNYRQTACFYRCEADHAEEEYKRSKRIALTK